MRSMTYRRVATAFLTLALLTLAPPAQIGAIANADRLARVQEDYARLPLSFEANQGQAAGDVKFLSRGRGYTLFLTSSEAVLALTNGTAGTALRMKTIGANPVSRIEGLQKLPGTVNYFIGKDRSKWRTNIQTYERVRYQSVYPGVDLIYYGNQRQLEYDFVVAPGRDPGMVKIAFEGATNIECDGIGNLILRTAGGDVRMQTPLVYQEIGGVKRVIASRYVLDTARRVAFEIGAYDRSRPLVIDPVLSYSTYLGGSGTGNTPGTGLDQGHGIAVDASGHAYVTGLASANFPTTAGAFDETSGGFDAFVTKINPSGTALVYSTYLGGSSTSGFAGSGFDTGTGIAVDSSGNAYVTGWTTSLNFPTTPGAFEATYDVDNCSPLPPTPNVVCPAEAFVVKINATGTALEYATFLGRGSGSDIAVDALGNAYVTGGASANFPTTPGAFDVTFSGGDAFVTKINSTGSALEYSMYLGGSGEDGGGGIAVDASGHAYVTGVTRSSDFPTTPGAFDETFGGGRFVDAFVTKINPTGTGLDYSTYLGGSRTDSSSAIAVDVSGSAYVTGRTTSPNFPTTPGAFAQTATGNGDAFVTKIDVSGTALVYSTYLGGSGAGSNETGSGIAVDASGSAYVAGFTDSIDFPTTPDALAPTFNGGLTDAFITKIDVLGSALGYSTYLGGRESEAGGAIAVDAFGNIFVTGQTDSNNFPTTPGAFAESRSGGFDAFVAKISTATIESLLAQVGMLDLEAGQQNSLASKLEAAERSLARGNPTAASNQLGAFVNQIEALARGGRLDAATAERLIAQAQAIIGQL